MFTSATRIRYVCWPGVRVTLLGTTTPRAGEKSKRYGANSSRKHREIVVLACLLARRSARVCTHTHAHTHTPCLLWSAENHAQLSVVKSPAARGEKGALEKGSHGANTATGGCAAPCARIQWRNSPAPVAAPCKIFMYSRARFSFFSNAAAFFTPPLSRRLLNVRRASASRQRAIDSPIRSPRRLRASLNAAQTGIPRYRARNLRATFRLFSARRRRTSFPQWKINGI